MFIPYIIFIIVHSFHLFANFKTFRENVLMSDVLLTTVLMCYVSYYREPSQNYGVIYKTYAINFIKLNLVLIYVSPKYFIFYMIYMICRLIQV